MIIQEKEKGNNFRVEREEIEGKALTRIPREWRIRPFVCRENAFLPLNPVSKEHEGICREM
jgi:hypothetical protein